MPNWCYNFATLNCPSKEIYDKLLNAIEEKVWFETFAPLGLDPEIHENGWDYDKALEVWKTKWSVTDVEILNQYDDELLLELSFETAWSPPTGVYRIMNKNYNIDITAFYDEEGCDFFGRCVYSKDEEIDESYEFPTDKKDLEELRQTIGSELYDYMSSTWERLEEEWQQEDEDSDEDEDEDEDEDDESNIIKKEYLVEPDYEYNEDIKKEFIVETVSEEIGNNDNDIDTFE